MSTRFKLCLKAAATLNDADAAALADAIEAYRSHGMDDRASERAAVSDLLAQVEQERKDITELLRAQHPDLFVAANEAPKIDTPAEPVDQAGSTEQASKIEDSGGNTVLFSRAKEHHPQTDTPEFKRWFGDSKVVDAEGKPLVVYHGTDADFSSFDTNRGEMGAHFGTKDHANQIISYWVANGEPGRHVMPAFLAIRNPLRLVDNGSFGQLNVVPQLQKLGLLPNGPASMWGGESGARAVRRAVEKAGYDGIVYENSREGRGNSWIAFRPEQIKSAIGNRGTFDPTDPRIDMRRGGGRGVLAQEIQNMLDSLAETGLRGITVLESPAGLPLAKRSAIMAKAPDGAVRGAYFRSTDEIYLFADNLKSLPEAVFVTLHEGFHRGLHITLGEEGAKVLRQIYATNKRVRELADSNMREFKIGKEEAINEALADLAGSGEAESLKGWAKLARLIRDWLAKIADAVGIELTYSDAMVSDLIARMTKAGLKGGVSVNVAPAQELAMANRDQVKTAAFKAWFGDSKVVDENGQPRVMYHGTGQDFSAFRPNQADAIFVTSEPIFAQAYADTSAMWMQHRGQDGAANILPVYVKAEDPFDYQNAQHREDLADKLTRDGKFKLATSPIITYSRPDLISALKDTENNWLLIEDRVTQEAIRALGHDGFYVSEGGFKNLAVYDPKQIKSAVGNQGTFNGAMDDLRLSRGEPDEAPLLSRASTAQDTQQADNEPARASTSAWRDQAGRVKFAPGQALYDLIGRTASPLLTKLRFKAASPELQRQLRQMKMEVEKAQETALAVARETHKLSEGDRAMVSDIIEKELAAGSIPPAHAVRLAGIMNGAMGAQSKELVRLGMLTQETADRWDGAYLPRFYESKLRKQAGDAWADAIGRLFRRTSAMKGIQGKHLKGRGLYETIPAAELPSWEALGWEKRDPGFDPTKDSEVQVWRDFTREERDKMGEIRDAGFRFVMGYMQTQRDIALGRMFEGMADDPSMSSRTPRDGWVRVPDTTIEGTGAARYGKLSGRYVPSDVMSHLSQIEEAQSAAWQMYRKALAIWKMGKTALNPVSHVNNILSNITMAHFAGVSYHRADKYIAAARDFVKSAPMLKEAKDAGLFLGTMSDAELIASLPKELQELAGKAESKIEKGAKAVFDMMTFFLRKPMGLAYQNEDLFFRYLIFKDARENGMPASDAVDWAQKFIFTYDDLPKGARMVRDFGIPFFSYTYKAVPALLNTAMVYPWRFAAPAVVLWAANAAAYAIAYGGDDDSMWEKLQRYLKDPDFRAVVKLKEKLEREHLPPWMKGSTALGTPKTIRLGTDEVTKLPVFIDTSRIVPGGDVFDVNPNAGGIPLPQPITPSHPLFTAGVALLANKDLWTGKDLTDTNDTSGEKISKRLDWIWKQVSPAIAVGNYHWERTMNALAQASGGEVEWLPEAVSEKYTGIARDGLPVQPKYAAMQTFGIKARPIDLDLSQTIDQSNRKKMIRDIDAEMRRMDRLAKTGAVSAKVADKAASAADQKKARLKEGLTVDGDKPD